MDQEKQTPNGASRTSRYDNPYKLNGVKVQQHCWEFRIQTY